MKGFLTAITTALVAVFAVYAVAHAGVLSKDMSRPARLMGNDLPAFLHYAPTDGAGYSGKIRRAMDPSSIQP